MEEQSEAEAPAASEPPRRQRKRKPRSGADLPAVADERLDDIARRHLQSATGGDVPPAESDPRRRDGASFGAVVFTEEAPEEIAEQEIRTLVDLTRFLDGTGQYYVHVVRRAPKFYGGTPCAGVQKKLKHFADDEDFVQIYGGGDYTLMLYGPPKRARLYDPIAGRVAPRPLTKPVVYTIPHLNPPNLNALIGAENDEEAGFEDPAMHVPGFRPTGRPTTSADAKIFETSLSHEERARIRQEERERELQSQLASVPQQLGPLVDRFASQQETMVGMLREEQRELRKENERRLAEERAERRRAEERAEAAMARPSETEAFGSALASVLGAINVNGKSGASQQELAAVREAAAADRERMMEMHQREIARVQEASERRARDAEDRAERRIKDAEERAERAVREAEERAERRVADEKKEADRRAADIERQYTSRLDDERRNHERELRSKDDHWSAKLESQKAGYEMRIETKSGEVQRLATENDRLRVEAERARDLPGIMQKFTESAEALGFSKANGEAEPGDWKSMLGQMALQAVQNLPEVIKNAGEAVEKARRPIDPATAAAFASAQYQGMTLPASTPLPAGYAPAPGPTRLFGTENGPMVETGADLAPPPGETIYAPAGPPIGPPPPAMAPLPPQAAHAVRAPPAPPPHAAPMQPASPPAAAPPPGPALNISDDQILRFRPMLEQALEQKVAPEAFAAELASQVGPQMAKTLAQSLTPDRISKAIRAQPGGALSPLVRREGQLYLKHVWDAIGRL